MKTAQLRRYRTKSKPAIGDTQKARATAANVSPRLLTFKAVNSPVFRSGPTFASSQGFGLPDLGPAKFGKRPSEFDRDAEQVSRCFKCTAANVAFKHFPLDGNRK